MRLPVAASSWLKRTSCDLVADTRRTGTVTNPKLIEPVQMACGTVVSPFSPFSALAHIGPTTFAGRGPFLQEAPTGGRRAGDGGGGGGPAAAPDQPRQGPLPRHWLHQRSGDRLLRPDRADDASPPRGPTGHDGPPPRWHHRRAVLREALPGSPPPLVGHHPPRRRLADHGVLARQRARAGVDRQPRRTRA